ncbi:MAG TPA: PIN domain-containing protein [Gemmataceae bacterium]|jgi:predicted nucleic acid-binding protein
MVTTAVEPIFVDTNILIYSTTALSPFYGVAQSKLDDLAAAGHPLWISRQILREYLAAMSRPGALTTPISMTSLLTDVQAFQTRFLVAEDGQMVTAHLLNLLGTISCAGKQVHDANIVATMLTHGIPKLLTHNTADFNRFSGQITIVPLIP